MYLPPTHPVPSWPPRPRWPPGRPSSLILPRPPYPSSAREPAVPTPVYSLPNRSTLCRASTAAAPGTSRGTARSRATTRPAAASASSSSRARARAATAAASRTFWSRVPVATEAKRPGGTAWRCRWTYLLHLNLHVRLEHPSCRSASVVLFRGVPVIVHTKKRASRLRS